MNGTQQSSASPLSAGGMQQPASSTTAASTPTQPYHHQISPSTNGALPSYASQDAAATAAAALSQQPQHIPTPNNAASGGRKRRAPGAPGSRGVANLTPEQLAKKRANDREAQRNIRERTRSTIESLERRIRELESQQPFQELQQVVRERDAARNECEELRRRLSAVAGLVGGAVNGAAGNGGPALNELAALTAQQAPLPPLAHGAQNSAQQSYPPPPESDYERQGQQNLHPDLRSPQSATHNSPVATATPPNSTAPMYQAGEGTLRRWSPSLDQLPQSHQHLQNPFQTQETHLNGIPTGQPPPLQKDPYQQHRSPENVSQMQGSQPIHNGDRHGVSFLLGRENSTASSHGSNHSPHSSVSTMHRSPPLMRHEPSSGGTFHRPYDTNNRDLPMYARVPPHVAPECPLDAILKEFLLRCRKQLDAGVPMSTVIGPEYPSLIGFYEPTLHQKSNCHPLSALFIDILSKFPDLSLTPEKVAVLHVMFLNMRWMICPCESCYLRLPEWLRPVIEQVEIAHGNWVDHLPWPAMRRALTLHATPGTSVKFDDFFVPYTTTMSLNWPYPAEQVFVTTNSVNPDDGSSIKMNPVFESHLMNLSNWSLGPKFLNTHPELCGGVRIEAERMGYQQPNLGVSSGLEGTI